ncbi:phytoene/squalene synthase family protein [Actinomadura sp. KC216]|uniref:phytoene/squalene synthase family protein n=1 Tax=Actinomadura sp. KC216 TaxID=2530370 RepID=UPI001046BEA0|nr:phytoene/squalene synthase family protein [Actinomadura sp. KC216]TDB88015.1 phytoene/squalene synthase family protein [Actinomadura sp. KC216]
MTLTASYERCRRLNARHGRSFYLATLLLPAWKRRHVHALYGFARHVDDIVDECGPAGAARRAAALDAVTRRLDAATAGEPTGDPVLPAFVHTVRSFGVERADIDAFLASMRSDLTVTRYATYEDLLAYMEGSAAAVGLMMLPVLETVPGAEQAAREPARELGRAFQLTNFIRDVAEDLERGRIYLPQEDLARFGVTEADLARGACTGAVRRLVAFESLRARGHYRRALHGVKLLTPSSRPCIRAAYELYGAILGQIAAAGHDVLTARARVPRRRRAAIYARHLLGASAASRAERSVPAGTR